MSNTISILLSAKDEASSTIGKLTSNISSGVENMAKSVQDGLNRSSVALGVIGVGLTAYAKNSTDFTADLVSNAKALQRQTGESITDSSKLLYVVQRMGGSAETAGSQFNIFAKQIQATRDKSAEAAIQQETLRNKIEDARIQITALTKEQALHGDSTGKLANKIGGLNIAVKEYERNLADLASPLDRIDVATQNADGSNRSFNDILLDVADRFKAMPNGVEKTTTALALFGKSGDEMIKTLNLGHDGILALEKKAEELGLTLTDKTVVAISNYIQSQKDLTDSTNGLKVQVGTLTAPVLTSFNKIITSMATEALKADTPLRSVVAGVASFGGPVATAGAGLLAMLANLFNINKGLGFFITTILGVSTAIVAGGGLLFALGSLLGLDFGPFGQAVGTAFGALVDWINRGISSLQNLTGSPEWTGIKSAAQKSLGVATGIVQGFTKALNDGTVTRVLGDIAGKFLEVAGAVGNYLGPKLGELWAVLAEKVLPTLGSLWHEVIEPLMPVLGVLLVGAIGLAVDAIRIFSGLISDLVNFAITNKDVLIPIIGAFAALATAMALGAAFSAITTAFTALTTTTIPAAIAKFDAFKLLMTTPIIMAAIGILAVVAAFEIVNGWADSTKAKIDGLSKDFDKAAAKTDDLIDKYKKGEITREQFSKGMADSNREMNDAQKKIDDVAARYNGIGGYFNWLYDNVTGNDPSKHKAKGGPVSAGQSYVVGDNPDGTLNDTSELFIPGSSGSIMSSKDLQAALSGSGRQQSPGLSKNVTLRIDNFNINNGGDSHRMLNDIGFALENAS